MKTIFKILCFVGSLVLAFGLVQFLIDRLYEKQGRRYITTMDEEAEY